MQGKVNASAAFPAGYFGGTDRVGAAISRPVVPPTGKQRRRNAPTMQYRTLYSEIRRYNVKTWNIRNIVTSPGQYDSAQKFVTLAGG